MKKYISKFHYLTQDLPHRSHAEQAETACQAGANWIQYRCLSKTDNELVEELNQVAAICDDWGATLIITNHYHLLNQVDAQGVHIEDMQADLAQIRSSIGDDKTLGASATSFTEIRQIYATGAADYIGCGPFSHTKTKPNTHSLLGTEGYRSIVDEMKKHQIEIPLIAVGGIQLNDTEALLAIGVYGLAVSAAINLGDVPELILKDFYRKIY